jgi:hypothetical protein
VSVLTNLCPEGASYRILPDGVIEVDGQVIEATDKDKALISKIKASIGTQIDLAAATHDVPASWVAGIVVIESGGNPSACSPCDKKVCSMAPNCGGPCCAYGIMQCIDSTAKSFCKRSGPSLTGDLEGGLDCGTLVFRSLLDKNGFDPIVAAKKYNGGEIVCGKGGIFGIGGQGNYVERFVRAANTYAYLPGSSPLVKASTRDVDKQEIGFPWWGWIALGGVGLAVAYRSK